MELYYKVILSIYKFIGVSLFRRFILFWEKIKSKLTGHKNTNYHLTCGSLMSIERFYGYLSYNSIIHIISLLVCFVYIILRITIYKNGTFFVFDMLIAIVVIFNLYCIALQHYTSIRMKIVQQKLIVRKGEDNHVVNVPQRDLGDTSLYTKVDVRVDRLQRKFKKNQVLRPLAIINTEEDIENEKEDIKEKISMSKQQEKTKNAYLKDKSKSYTYFYSEESSLIGIIKIKNSRIVGVKLNKKAFDKKSENDLLKVYIDEQIKLFESTKDTVPENYLHGLALIERYVDFLENKKIKLYNPFTYLNGYVRKKKNLTVADLYCVWKMLDNISLTDDKLIRIISDLPEIEYHNSVIPDDTLYYILRKVITLKKAGKIQFGNSAVIDQLLTFIELMELDTINEKYQEKYLEYLFSDNSFIQGLVIRLINDIKCVSFLSGCDDIVIKEKIQKLIDEYCIKVINLTDIRNEKDYVLANDILIQSYRTIIGLNKFAENNKLKIRYIVKPIWI